MSEWFGHEWTVWSWLIDLFTGERFGHMYYYLSWPSIHVQLMHVCKHFWKPHLCTLLFPNLWMESVIYGLAVARYGSTVPLPYHRPESHCHGLRIFMLQVYRIFANPLMDLVHIWHDDRYWSKHFVSTITTWSRINRWDVHGVATCEWGGQDVIWTGCGHKNEMIMSDGCHVWTTWFTCEEDDHMWTRLWLCELVGHVWIGSCVNGVWSVNGWEVIVVVMCERGGHVWTGWSRVNGVWSCERGRTRRRHWNLGPWFISISPARMGRVIKLVPFEGLKLGNPSELLRFPSFLVYAKHWDTPLVKFL